jgi:IS30 family transposase
LDKVLNFGINIKSLTLDNGVEFWEWIKMSLSIHTKLSAIAIYFCHPYSSYEKGSIENFNGLVRWHFPKGTDFRNYSQAQIDDVVNWINNYPREIHNYQSANEVYNQYVQN